MDVEGGDDGEEEKAEGDGETVHVCFGEHSSWLWYNARKGCIQIWSKVLHVCRLREREPFLLADGKEKKRKAIGFWGNNHSFI